MTSPMAEDRAVPTGRVAAGARTALVQVCVPDDAPCRSSVSPLRVSRTTWRHPFVRLKRVKSALKRVSRVAGPVRIPSPAPPSLARFLPPTRCLPTSERSRTSQRPAVGAYPCTSIVVIFEFCQSSVCVCLCSLAFFQSSMSCPTIGDQICSFDATRDAPHVRGHPRCAGATSGRRRALVSCFSSTLGRPTLGR